MAKKEGEPKRISRRQLLGLGIGTTTALVAVGGLGWGLSRLIESDSEPSGVSVTRIGTPTPSEAAGTPEPSSAPEVTKPAELPAWPKTAEEAGMVFGTDDASRNPTRWELSADGGWHFREEGFVSAVNPQGYVLEGYFDTKPGKNPDCFVSNGIVVGVQGATIWPVSGKKEATILLDKMALPKWDDGKVHPCRAVGFTPTK